MGTGIRRRAVATAAVALSVLAAWVPSAPVAAATTVSVWIQTLDACNQTIGGVGLSLAAGGAATVRVVPNSASRAIGGGCPAGRGDCTGASPSGCAVFSLTPPARGTQTYTVQQLSVPGGYTACDGGSACLGEVANFTLDQSGDVLGATVTDTLPDGVVTTQPASGGSFAATAGDPIVLHDDALGPGVCDGDGDADDQLAGAPTAHCDDHPDPALAHLVIAGTSLAGGQLVTGAGFAPMAVAGAPAGRHLVGSPAIVAGSALDPALEVGTFDDGALYVRSDAVGWQRLWGSDPGFTCVDNPAAYLDHTSATLWVACEGADHVLRYASGRLPATSLQLPALDGWTALRGPALAAGPAIAPAGPASTDDPTFFAVDAVGGLWTATTSTPWVARGAGCQGHPAAALGLAATTPTTVVACRSATGSLLYGAVGPGGAIGLTAATATTPRNAAGCVLGGSIVDGPGLAATGSGVLVLVTGAADHLPYVATIAFPTAPGAGPVAISPYQAISYQGGSRPGTCAPPSATNPATPLAGGPAVATWSGAALTVGLTTPTILAAPHSITTAVAHLVDVAGNPVSGRTVTFTSSMLVTAGATQSSSPGVYTTTVTPGLHAGDAWVGAASSWTSGSTSMRLFHGGYVLDGNGGIHPYGGAPVLATTAYWPGWDIARGIVLRPDGAGGYVVDGFGSLHPFGDAPAEASTAYWPGWDIARGVALRSDGVSGYVVDGFGGIHAFGGAPDMQATAVWPGWDIARGIVLTSDGGGYVLDGFGGLHPFGDAPAVSGSAYWPNWDIARGLAARPDGPGGYVLDGFGGVHPFGGAPELRTTAAWPGFDIARGLSVGAGGTGVVLDGYGGLSALGNQPPTSASAYWQGWDIARGVAGG